MSHPRWIVLPCLVLLAVGAYNAYGAFSAAAAGAGEPDAEAILQAVIDNLRGGSIKGTYTFIVERPGRTSQYVMEIIADGDQRGLIRVVAPPRDSGQAFLMNGDDLWVYNPRLGRSLRLPPSGRSNAFLGSDVNYNDIAGRDLEKDYTPAVTQAGADALTLELTPNPGAPTPYGRVLIEVEQESLAPRQVDYYDQRDQVVKRLTFFDYLAVGARRVPLEMVVEDRVREGYRTIVRLSDVQFDVSVPESCFTLQALERGCR